MPPTPTIKPPPRVLDAETRAVPIAALGLPPLYSARLAYEGVTTLGELSDWCGPDRDVRRVFGRMRAKRLERAVEAFWMAREGPVAGETKDRP